MEYVADIDIFSQFGAFGAGEHCGHLTNNLLIFSLNFQMPDKHRWMTPEQHQWLQDHFLSYMEAQAPGRYNIFWPTFFQKLFEKWSVSEPHWDNPTDSEHDSDSDSDQTNAESSPITSKRKCGGRKSKPKKKASHFTLMSYMAIY